MGVMSGLTSAIYTTASGATTFSNAMGGRIYFETAKTTTGVTQTTFPFAVFHFISHLPKYTFTSELVDVQFQWSLFDSTPSAVTMLANVGKLHDAFDPATLTVSGWTFIRLDREGHELFVPDEDGIRMSATTYRAIFQKN